MVLGFELLLALDRDASSLFLTRSIRLFAYGLIGVLLVLFLKLLGVSDGVVGTILTLTLIGDALVSLFVTTNADRYGRRLMLVGGSLLMALAGIAMALAPPSDGSVLWFLCLTVVATVGVISPSGNECGPFLALEQSILSTRIAPSSRASLFAWYNLIGSVSTAFGALVSGALVVFLTDESTLDANARTTTSDKFFSYYMTISHPFPMSQLFRNDTTPSSPEAPVTKLDSYRAVIAGYGAVGVVLAVVFARLSPKVEVEHVSEPTGEASREARPTEATALLAQPSSVSASSTSQAAAPYSWIFGNMSMESRWIVARLCCLFTLDSFAGSVITGSLLAYWFKVRFNVDEAALGQIMFVSNIISGASSLVAGWISTKVGLINTMVFTHLPANVLMILVPLMPNLFWAKAVLFLRYSIAQMDVGPRQAYVASIVPANERTAVIGLTNIVKSLGSSLGPLLAGYLISVGQFDVCFVVCGGLKIVYDLLLLRSFGGADREAAALRRGN
ncbi:MFS general substrate transporter [Chytriomyces cf. hyalinus JEL632]|nr:MFS general substrate transporter [Chytriomyces cf. hyalinus JEL632]